MIEADPSRILTETIKVGAETSPKEAAGSIAGILRGRHRCEIQAIGAAAVNQAVKAIAIARGYLAPGGIELACQPSFMDIKLRDGTHRTGIRLVVSREP